MFIALLLPITAAARDANFIGARVKSGSWRILRKKQQVEIWENDVRFIETDRNLRADWAKFDHTTTLLEASGSVRLRQLIENGVWLEIQGHQAQHNKTSGKGAMQPLKNKRVLFKLTGSGETGRGSARLLSWNQLRETIVMEGNVDFQDIRGTTLAEHAEYAHTIRTLTLTGRRPVLTGKQATWSSAVQADTITATELDNGQRRVTGTGRAQGWIFFDGPDRTLYH